MKMPNAETHKTYSQPIKMHASIVQCDADRMFQIDFIFIFCGKKKLKLKLKSMQQICNKNCVMITTAVTKMWKDQVREYGIKNSH